MTEPHAVLAALAGRHVLALPRATEVVPLAQAWFPAARWVREPVTTTARPMTGARFRGIATAPTTTVGVIELREGTEIVGPHPVDAAAARTLRLPARDTDLWGLPAGAAGDDGLVTAWATAAARRAGGGVLPATRDRVVVPDPDAVVDLSLWSAVPVRAEDALLLLRPALTGSRVALSPEQAEGQGFALAATYTYDGAVLVRCVRARQVPAVLSTLDWREHGPWGYHVTWRPPHGYDGDADHPSQLHVIARQRVAPAVARVTAALWRAAGGTVVDAGGFVVPPADVEARARA